MRLTIALMTALSIAAAPVLIAGCGVRGPLEPPPGAEASANPEDKTLITKEDKPNRGFILDGLLN